MLAKWPGSLHMVEHMGLSENDIPKSKMMVIKFE